MTERARKYLSDIQTAILLIEQFTNGISDFSAYEQDRKTQSAVERQLVIVGEALNQFKREIPNTIIHHDRQIVNFRNRLVHAYDSIDNAIVWAILLKHLPLLKAEILALEE